MLRHRWRAARLSEIVVNAGCLENGYTLAPVRWVIRLKQLIVLLWIERDRMSGLNHV